LWNLSRTSLAITPLQWAEGKSHLILTRARESIFAVASQ
jgi:hypothetical protein